MPQPAAPSAVWIEPIQAVHWPPRPGPPRSAGGGRAVAPLPWRRTPWSADPRRQKRLQMRPGSWMAGHHEAHRLHRSGGHRPGGVLRARPGARRFLAQPRPTAATRAIPDRHRAHGRRRRGHRLARCGAGARSASASGSAAGHAQQGTGAAPLPYDPDRTRAATARADVRLQHTHVARRRGAASPPGGSRASLHRSDVRTASRGCGRRLIAKCPGSVRRYVRPHRFRKDRSARANGPPAVHSASSALTASRAASASWTRAAARSCSARDPGGAAFRQGYALAPAAPAGAARALLGAGRGLLRWQ